MTNPVVAKLVISDWWLSIREKDLATPQTITMPAYCRHLDILPPDLNAADFILLRVQETVGITRIIEAKFLVVERGRPYPLALALQFLNYVGSTGVYTVFSLPDLNYR